MKIDNKIISFYNEGKKLINREFVYPRFVSIWLTTACNLNCSYCFFKEHNKQKREFINSTKLISFLKQLKKVGVEGIEFSGGGEPTLHKDCFVIAKVAKKLGFKVGMLTNGFKFDYMAIDCFSYIRIGLDAYNSEQYMKIKNCPGRVFDEVIENIHNLVSTRKNSEFPKIGIKFMLNKINKDSIDDMIKLSTEIPGVDYCHFKSTHSDKLTLSDEEVYILENKLNKYKLERNNFIRGSLFKNNPSCKCFMSPIHTVIAASGNIQVCCYFYQDKYVIGTIEDRFKRVWGSRKHQKIIDSISIRDCAKYDCRWNKYNTEMYKIITNGEHELSFI